MNEGRDEGRPHEDRTPHPNPLVGGDTGEPYGHGRWSRGHQAAPDRPGNLHPLQHLRGDLPRQRDHARRQQLRGARRCLQWLHGLHITVPHGFHRQLAHHAFGACLFDRRAV